MMPPGPPPPQGGMGGDPGGPPGPQAAPIPEPSEDEIKKYDLEILDYGREQDQEDIDFSVGD